MHSLQRMSADASETQARVASFSELDAKILVAGSTISTEQFRAMASEQMLQSQISSLLVNTDPVALNSLAELVTDYKTNGLSLQARSLYLEGVVSTLCRKPGLMPVNVKIIFSRYEILFLRSTSLVFDDDMCNVKSETVV